MQKQPKNSQNRPQRKLLISFAAACLLTFASAAAIANDENDTPPRQGEGRNVGENTGLALPRWAALKSNHINARSGPGDNYPVKAVYKRAGLPVEIISEFKLWREIVDIEGEHNWVHKAMLSGNRSAIIKEETYAYAAAANSSATAKLEKGAQVRIEECGQTYCRMHVENGITDIKGWVEKSKLWGVYPNEIFD